MRLRIFVPLWVLSWLLLSGVAGLCAEAAPEYPLEIENLRPDSEIEHYYAEGKWLGKNGVRVKYGEAVLMAERLEVDERARTVKAEGNVTLQRGKIFWKGERLEYGLDSHELKSQEFRTGINPVFVGGLELQTVVTNRVQEARDALITTDDLSEPSFQIRAKKVRVVVGEWVEAEDAWIYVGKTPVFWLPKYHRRLTKHQAYLVVTPGYRTTYGGYVLNRYEYEINDHFDVGMDMDFRQKRGFGYGPEANFDLGAGGSGNFSAYKTRDDRPGEDEAGVAVPKERHRISFDYTVGLRTNLTAKVVVREQSDALVVRDFFERQYRTNSQPVSFVELSQLWSNFSLDVLAMPQINDFYQTVERLPDVKLTSARQEIGESPLYYEGESSAGYFRFRSGLPGGTNYAAGRADSYHQVILPQTFFGWLNFTPRVGGRFTHYSESDGEHVDYSEADRFIFNTGAETSFKVSRVWQNAKNHTFDVDGLRHIMEPSFNYVFVPSPGIHPSRLPEFDGELPSLRLLPVDYPDYNAIDSVDSQNVIRLGLRNTLQTKRNGDVQNLLKWALVTDWRVDRRPDQTRFSDVYSDIDFSPRRWIVLNSELRYDVGNSKFNGANHSITLLPNEVWSLKLGHRYYSGAPDFLPDADNNTIYDTIYYRLNENWGLRMSHHFESRDGTMEEQMYTIYRDFRSWTGALTFRARGNRKGPDDYSVAFTFSSKSFPTRKVGTDASAPSFLLGS